MAKEADFKPSQMLSAESDRTVSSQASFQSVETKLTSTVLIQKQYLGCKVQSGRHLPCLKSVEQRGHFLQKHNLHRPPPSYTDILPLLCEIYWLSFSQTAK